MGMVDILKNYLESTIKMIVDNPNDVKLEVSTSTKTILIQIKANKTDFGKIIGRKGKTIESLKTIACAIKNTTYTEDARSIGLEIIEDEVSSFKPTKKD
jgi:hypothetical protein